MVVTLGQQCHVGEKPTVTTVKCRREHTNILNNCIDRHAGKPDKIKTNDTISLDYSSICYIASRIVVAGVQLNFMWCGNGKTNHNDEPHIKLVMFVFYKRIPLEPFAFLPRQVGM